MAEIHDIESLLSAIENDVDDRADVSFADVISALGQRTFGPFLLLAGLVMAAPGIGDIPGVPTAVGFFVALISVQMLFGRERLWVPAMLLERQLSGASVCKAIARLKRPAAYIDAIIKPRLTELTTGAEASLIAVASSAIALSTPVMEVIILSANLAGAALAAYGLALVSHDGLLALGAHALAATATGLLLYFLI